MSGRTDSGSRPADRQALLRALLEEQGLSAVSPIPRSEAEGPAPASFGQQRLWFVDRLDPGNPAYTIVEAVRLHGALDTGVLEWSLTEIVRRHEVLRTAIVDIDADESLTARYLFDIPVLKYGDEELSRHRLDRDRLMEFFARRSL